MAKVSVIIPLYNSETFIDETLDSVLCQTHNDLEVIAVDDGSSDNTCDVVQSKKDSRIRYVGQNNAGISLARNRAIHLAKGDYVAFIDHDDKWLPDKLERQISVFNKDRALGLVFSDAFIINATGKKIGTFFKIARPCSGMVFEKLVENNFIPILTAMVKKEVFDKVGFFDPRYRIVEDWDFLLRVAGAYPVDYIDMPLAEYRAHEKSFSKNRELMLTELISLLSGQMDAAKKTIKRYLRKNRSAYSSILGALYLKSGKACEAKRYFLNALKDSRLNIRAVVGLAGTVLPGPVSAAVGKAIDTRNMHGGR